MCNFLLKKLKVMLSMVTTGLHSLYIEIGEGLTWTENKSENE